MRLRPALVVTSIALVCGCTDPERIRPAPEQRPAPPAPMPAPPLPDLRFADMHCTYGGTAPAFFVWVETTATGRITDLHATKFEIKTKSGFVSGADGPILVRTREKPRGVGEVTPLVAPLEKDTSVHLEVFGPLALAAFGPGATYPSDDRVIRVELVAKEGQWTLSTTCLVGVSG